MPLTILSITVGVTWN